MRLLLSAVLPLLMVAQTQAGFLLGRPRCEPPIRFYHCPPPQFFYFECLPCPPIPLCPTVPLGPIPIPDDKQVVLSEEEYSGGSVPLYGYYDSGLPPTGHDSWFGPMTGGGPINRFFYTPPSPFFGGLGWGLGWGFGGGFRYGPPTVFASPPSTIINYGPTIINGDTFINYGPTIINNWTTTYPEDHDWCNRFCPPICTIHCPTKGHCHDDKDCNDHPNPHGPPTITTPEPSSIALMASGIPAAFGLFLVRKRLSS
jgi:hypothetical protein